MLPSREVNGEVPCFKDCELSLVHLKLADLPSTPIGGEENFEKETNKLDVDFNSDERESLLQVFDTSEREENFLSNNEPWENSNLPLSTFQNLIGHLDSQPKFNEENIEVHPLSSLIEKASAFPCEKFEIPLQDQLHAQTNLIPLLLIFCKTSHCESI